MRKWLDFLWCGVKNRLRFHSVWLSAAFSRMIHSEQSGGGQFSHPDTTFLRVNDTCMTPWSDLRFGGWFLHLPTNVRLLRNIQQRKGAVHGSGSAITASWLQTHKNSIEHGDEVVFLSSRSIFISLVPVKSLLQFHIIQNVSSLPRQRRSHYVPPHPPPPRCPLHILKSRVNDTRKDVLSLLYKWVRNPCQWAKW